MLHNLEFGLSVLVLALLLLLLTSPTVSLSDDNYDATVCYCSTVRSAVSSIAVFYLSLYLSRHSLIPRSNLIPTKRFTLLGACR